MKNVDIQDARVLNVPAKFHGVWTLWELVAKKKLVGEETLKKCTIFFFLARARPMLFERENMHAPLMPKKNHIFCFF